MSIGLIIGGTIATVMQLFPPSQEALSQNTFSVMPNRIPNIAELILMRYRGLVNKDMFKEYGIKNGFISEWSDALYYSQVKLLQEGDLISAWRRGIITEGQLHEELEKHQYTQTDIENIKKVSEYYPSAPDLVRFAVREVYSPNIVQEYGLKSDLPTEFLTEASKAGLSGEQAQNYWAAHWELPSINQGFEMLHRGVINDSELNTLLRSLDVMPYWRDKLTQISYNPLTRVDVRRMYALGVLDREGVKKAYLDIGYNDANAELMTDFTIKYESNEDAGLTRSSITAAYKKDLITDEQFAGYLARLGYAEDTITFYIELVDYEKYEEYVDMLVENITQEYYNGTLTLEQVQTTLTGLDLPSVYVESIVNKIKAATAKKQKLPTKSDVENWLKLQIIDEKEYSNYMIRQGYSEYDIQKYLEEISKEVDTSQKKFQTVTVYFRWLNAGIISETLFRDTLTAMKYTKKDIDNYVTEYKKSMQGEQ